MPYYILMTRCGDEFRVADRLKEGGHTSLCPSFEDEKYKSRPVLDGYLFLQCDTIKDINQIKSRYDILKVVGFNGFLSRLTEEDLEQIEEIAMCLEAVIKNSQSRPKQPGLSDLEIGDQVKVLVKAGIKFVGVYVGKGKLDVAMGSSTRKINIKKAIKFEKVA